MATAFEQIGRGGRGGSGGSRSRMYVAADAFSEQDAIDAVLTQLSIDLGGGTTLDGLALTGVDPKETSVAGVWDVTVTWGQPRGFTYPKPSDPSRTSFEFTQDTITAKVSLETRKYGDKLVEDRNTINVVKDASGNPEIRGVEVPSQAFSFSKTKVYAKDDVDDDFIATVASVYLHTNADAFAGFDAKEVLFAGCTGTQRDDDTYELNFRFQQQRNVIDETIGGIDGVTKYGWEYLEEVYDIVVGEDENGDTIELTPELKGFYVHKLFPDGDFSDLNLE